MFGIFGSGVRVLGLWVLGLGKRCDAGMVVGLFSFGLSLTGSGLALGGFGSRRIRDSILNQRG